MQNTNISSAKTRFIDIIKRRVTRKRLLRTKNGKSIEIECLSDDLFVINYDGDSYFFIRIEKKTSRNVRVSPHWPGAPSTIKVVQQLYPWSLSYGGSYKMNNDIIYLWINLNILELGISRREKKPCEFTETLIKWDNRTDN